MTLYLSNWVFIFVMFTATELTQAGADCMALAENFNRDNPELNQFGDPKTFAFCERNENGN